MNAKTVKLIRKWCSATGSNSDDLKRLWKNIPRNNRGKLSTNMKSELANAVPAEVTPA